jgi:hypothetical protein
MTIGQQNIRAFDAEFGQVWVAVETPKFTLDTG